MQPKLTSLDGQKTPEELLRRERFAFITGVPRLLGSPYTSRRYGQSGASVSNLPPHLTRVVDDLAIVHSVHTDHFNHAPAQIFMNTGHPLVGRPSMGSWPTYGLGSESSDLPGFVVLLSGEKDPGAGNSCWSSGFLPTTTGSFVPADALGMRASRSRRAPPLTRAARCMRRRKSRHLPGSGSSGPTRDRPR